MPALSRISLVLILAGSTAFELLLNRVIVRLVARPKTGAHAGIYNVTDSIGLFFFYFVGLLAFGLVTWAVVVLIRDRKLLDVLSRTMIAIAGALFLPLAGLGQLIKLPPQVAPHLNTAFGVFVVALLVVALRRPIALRHKLGLIYLAGPLLLHVYWLLTQQLPNIAPVGARADLPSRLFEAGEHMVVVGAFAASFFFVPFSRWRNFVAPMPITLALTVSGSVGVLSHRAYPVAAQAAYYGLGINLPAPSFQWALHLLSLFCFSLTAAGLYTMDGASRAIGLGLLLVGLSGFQLQLPYQFLVTVAGLLMLLRGALAAEDEREHADVQARASAPKPEQWKRFLTVLGDRVGDDSAAEQLEAVVLQNERSHIARLRTRVEGRELSLRIIASGAQVDELEIALGPPPRDEPPAYLLRRRSQRSKRLPSKRGPRVDYDREFILRDSTGGVAETLSSPALRQQLTQHVHGALSLWPEEGLRYVARPLDEGWPIPVAEIAFDPDTAASDELEGLITALCEVAERTGF